MPDWRRVLDLPPYSCDETDLTEDRDPWKFETIKCPCGCDKRQPLQRELFQESEESEQPEESEGSKIRTWLLRGTDTRSIVKNASMLLNPAAAVLDKINKLRLTRNMSPLGNEVNAETLFKGALVQVRVTPVGRGSPDDLAMIHRLDDAEARRWKYAEEQRNRNGLRSGALPDETDVSNILTWHLLC